MKTFEYITITGKLPFPEIELEDLEGFIKLSEILQSACIFVQMDEDKKRPSVFLFLDERTAYKLPANGYKALDDYADARKQNFPDAESYYDARNNGFTSFKEYDECRKAGTMDKSRYVKAMKLGYIDQFNSFLEKVEKQKQNIPKDFKPESAQTALALFELATGQGFKDYGDFEKAFFTGFNSNMEWEDARQKGFLKADEYREAVEMGITAPKEYLEAKAAGIKTKQEFDKYNFLKRSAHKRFSFDEAHLMDALKMLENGKKLSLNRLRDLLKLQQEDYFSKNEKGEVLLPGWYSRKLNKDEDFKNLLRNNPDLNDHGTFDEDGEYYQVSRILDNKIYIDGSNVAHGNQRRDEHSKPKLGNILTIVKELKNMRFTDIIIISDSNLKHKVVDKKVMEELRPLVTYLESPAGTQADEFLLEQAKKSKCYIVSNDMFREWRRRDPWVAENVDRLRMPFMNVKGVVTVLVKERTIA